LFSTFPTEPASKASISGWRLPRSTIIRETDPTKTVIFLVGNKSDISNQREVESNDAALWAKNHNLRYFQTSAKQNLNIEDLFISGVKACLEKKQLSIGNLDSISIVNEKSLNKKPKRRGCCLFFK